MPSEIFITSNIAGKIRQYLEGKQYSGICIIVDENTEEHCLPLLLTSIPGANIISVKSGEENKTLATCEYIWGKMTEFQLDRKALVINIGGGVIGDMGGFCAATYKRGIDFIQVPTTLLSQVDASVGGKLGVDFNSFKNHIGVFCEPIAVFIDTVFLKTLSKEELRSGYAEVIKHCLIADNEKWEEINKKALNEQDFNDLVKHSVQIKAKITSEDPFESGLRKILNFGHTIGHAIESYFLNIAGKKLLHGEAIAIGMIAEAYIAHTKGFIKENELKQIKEYILSIFGHRELFEFDLEKIITLTLQDKKNERNAILCSLLESPGKANFNQPVQFREIRDALKYYSL